MVTRKLLRKVYPTVSQDCGFFWETKKEYKIRVGYKKQFNSIYKVLFLKKIC